MLTQSTGRYFYKQPELTRLEIGVFNGIDTTWTVYLGSKPAGCSGDLATSVLVDPVISSAPLRRWLQKDSRLEADSGDTCIVSYADTVSNGTYEYRYLIDTRQWLVARLQKGFRYTDGYSYAIFDGTYAYDWVHDTVPRLTRVALWSDTTLAHGGYRFREIEVNIELDDSLFADNVVRPQTARAGTRNAMSCRWRVSVLEPGAMRSLLGAPAFDILGRRRTSARDGVVVMGVTPSAR